MKPNKDFTMALNVKVTHLIGAVLALLAISFIVQTALMATTLEKVNQLEIVMANATTGKGVSAPDTGLNGSSMRPTETPQSVTTGGPAAAGPPGSQSPPTPTATQIPTSNITFICSYRNVRAVLVNATEACDFSCNSCNNLGPMGSSADNSGLPLCGEVYPSEFASDNFTDITSVYDATLLAEECIDSTPTCCYFGSSRSEINDTCDYITNTTFCNYTCPVDIYIEYGYILYPSLLSSTDQAVLATVNLTGYYNSNNDFVTIDFDTTINRIHELDSYTEGTYTNCTFSLQMLTTNLVDCSHPASSKLRLVVSPCG